MKEFRSVRRSRCGALIVDRRGTILGLDQAMEDLTGWPAIEVVGRNKELGQAGSGDEPKASAPLYEGELPAVPSRGSNELTVHCRDGRALQVETAVERLPGPGERLLVTILRIVARSPGRAPQNSERVDDLTGLPGADAFASRLAAEFRAAASAAQPLAMILADVDHLREINDRLGHDAGDTVLRKLAGILRVSIEDDSRLGRLENDDFAILMPHAGRGEARQVAAGLRSTVERYRFFPGETRAEGIKVTLSLGAASFPADAESETDLMERARDALDEARTMGRNRVWCYLRRPRVPVQVPVFFDAAESPLVGYTRDLSPSGIFVQTAAPMDIGMRCALAFPLPGYDGRVHVIARVVRTVPVETGLADKELLIPGMGVEFERFSGSSDRRAIETFLHEREASTLRPENGLLSTN